MLGHQLSSLLHDAFGVRGTAGSLVMVKDATTGQIFTIKGVSAEVHEDADGSTTHWIEVEPY